MLHRFWHEEDDIFRNGGISLLSSSSTDITMCAEYQFISVASFGEYCGSRDTLGLRILCIRTVSFNLRASANKLPKWSKHCRRSGGCYLELRLPRTLFSPCSSAFGHALAYDCALLWLIIAKNAIAIGS